MFSPNEHAENFACALLGHKLYVISKSCESAHHKFDFELTQKLQDTKFNYHFITSILRLQNSVAQIQDFLVFINVLLIQVVSWFVESCKSCLSFYCNLIAFFKQVIGCCI